MVLSKLGSGLKTIFLLVMFLTHGRVSAGFNDWNWTVFKSIVSPFKQSQFRGLISNQFFVFRQQNNWLQLFAGVEDRLWCSETLWSLSSTTDIKKYQSCQKFLHFTIIVNNQRGAALSTHILCQCRAWRVFLFQNCVTELKWCDSWVIIHSSGSCCHGSVFFSDFCFIITSCFLTSLCLRLSVLFPVLFCSLCS